MNLKNILYVDNLIYMMSQFVVSKIIKSYWWINYVISTGFLPIFYISFRKRSVLRKDIDINLHTSLHSST